MSDPFKRQHPGYRGRTFTTPKGRTGRYSPPRKSRGGQCPCCTTAGTKAEQNRRARAGLVEETREEIAQGLADMPDQYDKDEADSPCGLCLDDDCEHCWGPCPECGVLGCSEFPGCLDPPWAAMTDEDMPAPILLDEHLGWECPECGDPECDSFYAGCSIRVEPRCVFETYPDGVPPLGVVCSCPKHSPRCM